MKTIKINTIVSAPPERCFDLALDLDHHQASAARTDERVVQTTARSRLLEGDTVTFEARHFGIRWRMTARITAYERPYRFVDEQERGPFRSFRHVHRFEEIESGTRMVDVFEFSSPLPSLSERVLARHLESFLTTRAEYLKERAEAAT